MINEFSSTIVWSVIQISMFALIVGLVVELIRRKMGGIVSEILTVSMALIIMFSMAAFLPLPSWISWQTQKSVAVAGNHKAHQLENETASLLESGVFESSPVNKTRNSTIESDNADVSTQESVFATNWSTGINRWWSELSTTPAKAPLVLEPEAITSPPIAGSSMYKPTNFAWTSILCGTMLVFALIGILRLVIGIASISKLRRRSQEIVDPELLNVVAEVKSALGIERPVRVLQTDELVSAATIGWVKPAILLPTQWKQWRESELVSAIAHELAHVSSNDYAKNLVAQSAVALNFFNPIVHWLGRELRVAQELAADEKAAHSSGGRRNYLLTMAEMALNQDTKQLGWLAQPFLPTRKTFLRRIEMLKGKQKLRGLQNKTLIWFSRFAVFTIAIICVSVRMPATNIATAITQDPIQKQEEPSIVTIDFSEPALEPVFQATPVDATYFNISQSNQDPAVSQAGSSKLAYVSDRAKLFIQVDLDQLREIENFQPMLEKYFGVDDKGRSKSFLPLSDFSSFSVQVFEIPNDLTPRGGMIINLLKPWNEEEVVQGPENTCIVDKNVTNKTGSFPIWLPTRQLC